MTTISEKEKLALVIEQLEAERKRREDEAVEAGKAIRLSLTCVVPPGLDADKLLKEAEAQKIAALRAAGETRDVYWEPLVIYSGVPALARPMIGNPL
jgi:hypothetical protein